MNIGVETGDFSFFGNSGEDKIKQCFHQVLSKNNAPPKPTKPKPPDKPKKPKQTKQPQDPNKSKPRKKHETPPIDADFKAIFEGLDEAHRFDWPNNKGFSNGFKHLYNQYSDNVVTNLMIHGPKHITEYLKMEVFKLNINNVFEEKFLPNDIDCVVQLITKEKDIRVPHNDPEKLGRCQVLYEMVHQLNAFPEIDLHELTTDEHNWFKSIPMYLAMQRAIDGFNRERAEQQRPKRMRKSRKPKARKARKARKKRNWLPKRKQMLDDLEYLPHIRNLVVIPMCDFRRAHFRIDCTTMHQVLSSLRLLPKMEYEEKGIPVEQTIKQNDFIAQRDTQWNTYFYMRKIRRSVRGKKSFDFSINTDGISVSLQYSCKKKPKNKAVEDERLRGMITDGTIQLLGGTDTGMKSWNTTVTHDIKTGKEVSFIYIYFAFV